MKILFKVILLWIIALTAPFAITFLLTQLDLRSIKGGSNGDIFAVSIVRGFIVEFLFLSYCYGIGRKTIIEDMRGTGEHFSASFLESLNAGIIDRISFIISKF